MVHLVAPLKTPMSSTDSTIYINEATPIQQLKTEK